MATPNNGFQYNLRSTAKLRKESIRVETMRISAILHTASSQDFKSAKQILASVTNDINGLPEALSADINKTDVAIVDSIAHILEDLKSRRRTIGNQHLQDSILFGVFYNLPLSFNNAVAKRLSIHPYTLDKINTKCKTVREKHCNDGNLMYFSLSRKKRKDAHSENRAIECIHDYCHNDENGTRIESNLNAIKVWINDKGQPCKKSLRAGDDTFEFHPGRTWDGVVTSTEKYKDFCASEDYLNWRSRQPNPAKVNIAKTAFLANICPCVKKNRYVDCADVNMSAIAHAMRAIKSTCIIRGVWSCECDEYHSKILTHMKERSKIWIQ